MRLAIFDFETTGPNPETCEVCEYGVMLTEYSRLERSGRVLATSGNVVSCSPIPPEVTALHGITDADVTEFGVARNFMTGVIVELMRKADVIVGHNAVHFDMTILRRYIREQLGVLALTQFDAELASKPFIDTMIDIPVRDSAKLKYMAYDYGVIAHSAHRALFDCATTWDLLLAGGLDRALESARSPMVEIKALVSFDDKDKAKQAGFHWEPGTKSWLKRCRENRIAEFEKLFRVLRIEQQPLLDRALAASTV